MPPIARNINAVTKYVGFVDDYVAQIDPNTEPDALLLARLGLAVEHPALDLHGAAHRVDDAGELGQEAVTGVLHGTAPMLGDFGIDKFA